MKYILLLTALLSINCYLQKEHDPDKCDKYYGKEFFHLYAKYDSLSHTKNLTAEDSAVISNFKKLLYEAGMYRLNRNNK